MATHLTLSFNYPARWVQETNVTWGCEVLFDDMTAAKLGVGPACSLLEDLLRLEVRLGDRASLQVGDTVTLRFGVFVPAGVVYLPTELETTATTKEPAVAVHAVLVAPDISPICARLRFSTALSTGFAGRAPVISWHLGNATHEALGQQLQPALGEASDFSEQVLEIPPEMLFSAVSVVQEEQSNVSEMVLEVVSTITNWHGETDEAAAVLVVLDVEAPLPQIVPTTFQEMELRPSQPVEMAVQVHPTADAAFCLDLIRRAQRPRTIEREVGNETIVEELPPEPAEPLDPGSILVHWDYRRLDEGACFWVFVGNESNDTDNFSNLSNVSRGSLWNLSCPMMQWHPLENLSYTDLDRAPGTVRLPGFSFEPNSSHQFRATAVRKDYAEAKNKSKVTYTLSVTPAARPSVSFLAPPREASTACGFSLRALAAEAHSETQRRREELAHGFEYAWSCMLGVMADMNESEVEDAERCLHRLAGVWTSSPELVVEAGELAEDSYTITVHARRLGEEEEAARAVASLRLVDQLQPRVSLRLPWRPEEPLSTSSAEVRAFADVLGSRSCPVPLWSWQWLLVSADSVIMGLLQTMNESSLQEVVGNLTLSTLEFRADLLMPGSRYVYALVGHDPANTAARMHLVENATLAQLASAGAFVTSSHAFRADSPPAFGVIESTPRTGVAVSTLFTLSTFGWLDETEDGLSYAFFRFPLENAPGVSPEDLTMGLPDTDFEWTLPRSDWHNASSPSYFQKQGGLLLRTWDRAKSLADVAMAAGSYYLVVRARDPLGAEGLAAVLGPVVTEPAELSAVAATNALKAASASSDVDRILNAVDATLSVPVAAPFATELFDALEAAAAVVESSPEALEKMSYVVSSVVSGGRTGMGLLSNKSQLTQAAVLLDGCINLALDGPQAGVGPNLGVAVLESISSVNHGGRLGNAETAESESINFTAMLETLTSTLADASLAKMRLHESMTMDATSGGTGASLELSRTTTADFWTGLKYGRLGVPRKVELMSRRLQSTGGSCNDLDVKLTFWRRGNPYNWADPGKGMNRLVFPNCTVAVLQLQICGAPVFFNDTDPDAAVEIRDIDLPPKPPFQHNFWLDVACARWSPNDLAWVFDGVKVKQPVYHDDVKVSCMAYYGGAAYAAVWLPVEVTTSTTTLEWTYPAYTTFFVPSLPPVYVVSCNETLLPDPPAGTWDCTKPGEGQECRAPCFGFPDRIFSMTCLKGAETLEWFNTNICPVFTTTTTDHEVPIPSEEAITGGLLIFVWIVLVTCGAGVAALLCYGGYRFVDHESRRRSSVSRVVFPQEDHKEEVPIDPTFRNWAQQWAEHPTVAESAVVEIKHQASRSQESLAIVDDSGSSPERLEASVDATAANAPGPSAFTETVQLEYSDDWREKLDSLLESRDIPRQTEGRLYYVVNTVREVLYTKDLETLHKVNFPLHIHMQEGNPTVEKSDAFYAWQVEWGALRESQDPDVRELPKKELDKMPAMAMQQTFDVPKLPKQQQDHQDLMKKWREQQQQQLRSAAAASAQRRPSPEAQGRLPKSPQPGSDSSGSPRRRVDPVQEVFDRYQISGHVTSTGRFGGALADTAAQASVLVPELQASYYQDVYDTDQGWLEVQSPSGRIYYWNQITQEVWDPPEEREFVPD